MLVCDLYAFGGFVGPTTRWVGALYGTRSIFRVGRLVFNSFSYVTRALTHSTLIFHGFKGQRVLIMVVGRRVILLFYGRFTMGVGGGQCFRVFHRGCPSFRTGYTLGGQQHGCIWDVWSLRRIVLCVDNNGGSDVGTGVLREVFCYFMLARGVTTRGYGNAGWNNTGT